MMIGMERVFENQKCIKVSLAHVYNSSLVIKTEEKSLSKTAKFLKSAIETPKPLSVESTLSVAQSVLMDTLKIYIS